MLQFPNWSHLPPEFQNVHLFAKKCVSEKYWTKRSSSDSIVTELEAAPPPPHESFRNSSLFLFDMFPLNPADYGTSCKQTADKYLSVIWGKNMTDEY